MAIFVFSTKKPMEMAAYMDEWMRNVVLVGGLMISEEEKYHGKVTGEFVAKSLFKTLCLCKTL